MSHGDLGVMVLAAGLGTRLRPLTLELPKPLVWLGDRPQIDHVLALLAEQGITRIVLNTHHLPEAWTAAWRAAQPLAVEIVHEPAILGTGGGIANARDRLGSGEVLIYNGDIVAPIALTSLRARRATSGAEAVLVCGPRLEAGRGTVGVDEAGRVVRLRAFRGGEERYSLDYAGIALLGPRLVQALPRPEPSPRTSTGAGEDGTVEVSPSVATVCLVGDGFLPALARGELLVTTSLDAPFIDVGTKDELLHANLAWLDQRGLPRWVAPDAHVAGGVELGRVVIGPGAKVTGTGRLDRAVVWPRAVASAPACDVIVTPRVTVSV